MLFLLLYSILAPLIAQCAPDTTEKSSAIAPTSIVQEQALPSATATASPAPSATPSATPSPSPSATATATATATTTPIALSVPQFSYPISWPNQVFGAGFYVRHATQTENTWYNPGYWHTGEDWYALDMDTAGAQVHAIADGVVVYAGSNYPGRVVIIRHHDALFSMYGHLDFNLAVQVNQEVQRGQLIGTVLKRDDTVPNHLHFEVRNFLINPVVNGVNPRYNFRCGPSCPPGPGYWPMNAPELPSAIGWMLPLQVINHSMLQAHQNMSLLAVDQQSSSYVLRDAPRAEATAMAEIQLEAGQELRLLDWSLSPALANQTGATAYQIWYLVELADGQRGWIAAIAHSTNETGSNGQASSIYFRILPNIASS